LKIATPSLRGSAASIASIRAITSGIVETNAPVPTEAILTVATKRMDPKPRAPSSVESRPK
jgi:hypothetical protein